MSNVIRLNEDLQIDLDLFRSRYLTRLRKDVENHKDSSFLVSLLREKESYDDKDWLAFAVRFSANYVNDP